MSFIVMAKGMTASNLFVNAFFVLLWTFLLNVLCQKGYTALSWVLVALPIILLFVVVVFIGEIALAGALSAKGSVSPSSASMSPSPVSMSPSPASVSMSSASH
jgi:flagellar biosynthesis protein FlhB